ncbi:serine hydrolase [Bacillus cereus group sp. BfR-BA-01380]|uniref:serine hydrolase domain-containing protein n=1 Tax=Bacillus cereus group sp. BfR-BA-01380 TaxID=2920324 RepID=UPI001F5A5177|nr:serine hydrolase domain-containing protein [Bacillus cereus group sp. BfR-BA-01380]
MSNYVKRQVFIVMKSRKPIVYIKRTIILSLLFTLIYWGYAKIISNNKEKETLQAMKEVKKEVKKEVIEKPKEELVAQQPPQEINNNAELDKYVKSKNFSGTAVVVKNGKVLLNKGYGLANQEKNVANNSETSYYIGSITKAFIATSIMQLKEQNKLNTEDTVAKYIPDFPRGKEIKLVHLLTHTSGIPEYSEGSENISHEELIKRIGHQKLAFPPGSKWKYSDSNYSVLAYIAEKVSGQSLEDYIQKNIFEVAGMKHSGFGDKFQQGEYPSTGYKIVDNKMTTPALPSMSQLFGCGDVYMTAYDLYLFDQALFTGKLISSESYHQMFTAVKKDYGFGWYVDPGSYSNHGVMPGWNCLNSFSKDGNTYVVLLSNIQNNIKSFGAVSNDIYTMVRHAEG